MKNKKEFKKTLIDANLSLLVLLIGFFIILLSPLKLQAQEAVNFDNNINMQGTHRVINLAEPEVSSDAATLNYVDTEITNQIPDGQAVGQTFYWTGSEWLPSSNLYHDGTSVGIGTTDPNAKLEVDGLTKINGVLYREGYYDGILNQHAGVIESPGSGWVKLVTNIPFADNVMSNQIRIDVWKPGESHSLIIGSAIFKGAFVEPTYTYLGNGVPPQVVLAEENSFVTINIKNINHIWEGGPTATVRVIGNRGLDHDMLRDWEFKDEKPNPSPIDLIDFPTSTNSFGHLFINGKFQLHDGVMVGEISTNTNLGTSDGALSTQNAIKTYVDDQVGGSAGISSGTINQTLRHDGTGWVESNNLINDDTNVGIGTTDPGDLLELKSPTIGTKEGIFIHDPSTGLDYGARFMYDDANSNVIMGSRTNGVDIDHIVLNRDSAYVGIGTVSPQETLHVDGSIRVGSWGLDPNAVPKSYVDSAIEGGETGVGLWAAGTGDDIYKKVTTGNVGIGITNPGAKLHVSGGDILLDNNRDINWKDTGGAYRDLLRFSSANEFIVGTTVDYSMKLQAGTNQDVIIWDPDSSLPIATFPQDTGSNIKFQNRDFIVTGGDVGIGTTNPGTALDVNGVITATGGTSSNWNTAYLERGSQIGGAGLTWDGSELDADAVAVKRVHLKTNVNAAMVQGSSNEFDVDFNLEEYNDSDVYSHSSGVVTVLSDGVYRIYANLVYENGTSSARNTANAYVKVNGSMIASTQTADYDRGASYGKYSNNKVQTTISLSANDTVSIGTYAINEDGTMTITSDRCEFIVEKVGTEAVANTWRPKNTDNALQAADGSPTDAVYVDGAGSVGIGTTDPQQELDVAGDALIDTIYDQDNSSYFLDPAANVFSYGLYTAGSIHSEGTADNYFAGNVGIGTTNPGAKLHVNGEARIPSISYDDNYLTVMENINLATDEKTYLLFNQDPFESGHYTIKLHVTRSGGGSIAPKGELIKVVSFYIYPNRSINSISSNIINVNGGMRSIRIGSPEINVNDKLQIPIYCSNAGSGRNFRFRMSFTGSTDAMSVMESYSFTTPVSATSPGDSYSTIEDRLGINLGPNVMPSATLTVDGNMALDAGTTIIDSGELNILNLMSGKTGSDPDFVTGLAGANGYLGMWNADGDLVQGPDPSSLGADGYLPDDPATSDVDMNNNAITDIDWATSDDGSGSDLDADLLDGNQATAFMTSSTDDWVDESGDTIDGGTNTDLRIISDDSGRSRISLYGDSQGTGQLYVGQSTSYGGGIEYNGDGSPITTGAGSDYITLYRVSSNNWEWTARNKHNSNDWEFREDLLVNGDISLPTGGIKDTNGVLGNSGQVLSSTGTGVEWTASSSGADGYLPDDPATSDVDMNNNAITAIDWATSDDGSGSDLDADLLDGNDSSAFMTSGTDDWVDESGDTMTGVLTIQKSGGGARIDLGAETTNYVDSASIVLQEIAGDLYGGSAYGFRHRYDGDSNIYYFDTTESSATITTVYSVNRGSNVVDFKGTPQVNGNAIWHANNDGPGTGLNADLLDGNDSSAFMPSGTDMWVNESGDTMTGDLTIQQSTNPTLSIIANDTGSSPAYTANIQIQGYEGRGKGIFLTDEDTSNEWFIGEAYSSTGISIGYDTTTGGQSEYPANSAIFVDTSRYVGIGTTNPASALDVDGKITADALDPVYNINGESYATWGHSTTGLKEETLGKVKLNKRLDKHSNYYYTTLDLEKAKKGSDLWLFNKITDFGKNWKDLIVSLSPQGRADVWYEFNKEENIILIFGTKEVFVSYRLVAPRFNWDTKYGGTNEFDGPDGKGIKVPVSND